MPEHIDHYEFGRIVIDGREERYDVILTPRSVHQHWWREQGHVLSLADLAPALEDSPRVLVVGTGAAERMQLHPGLTDELRARGTAVEAMSTAEAVRRVNELLGLDDTDWAAAMHLTC